MTSTTPQPQLRRRKRKAPHDGASKTSICLRSPPTRIPASARWWSTPPLTAAAVRVALDLPDDWRLRVWDDECEAYVLCADEAQPIAQYATAVGELQIALQPRAVRGLAGATPVPPPAWSRLGAPVSRGAYVSQHTAAPPRHAAAVASGGRVLELDDAADASHAALLTAAAAALGAGGGGGGRAAELLAARHRRYPRVAAARPPPRRRRRAVGDGRRPRRRPPVHDAVGDRRARRGRLPPLAS